MTDIVKKTRIANVAREKSQLSVSDIAAEKIQHAINVLGEAIIDSACASAVYNRRRTIMEQDADVALDALYNYLEVFDKIFAVEDDELDMGAYDYV